MLMEVKIVQTSQPTDCKHKHTPSTLYNEEYYLTACEGYDEFFKLRKSISPRLAASLKLVEPRCGERILDIGCGRGEAVLSLACEGVIAYGIDYSSDAFQVARRYLETEGADYKRSIYLVRADAKRLPFRNCSFNKLLMFDLVEHLYPWELTEALNEAHRVLVTGGQLIIHTAPNRWYYQFGYPLYRLLERLRGRHLPSNPRSRFRFHYLHVNEQDIVRLRRSLHRAGFKCRVWLDNIQTVLPAEFSPLLRSVISILLRVYPFRWVFCNDLFAIAVKDKR